MRITKIWGSQEKSHGAPPVWPSHCEYERCKKAGERYLRQCFLVDPSHLPTSAARGSIFQLISPAAEQIIFTQTNLDGAQGRFCFQLRLSKGPGSPPCCYWPGSIWDWKSNVTSKSLSLLEFIQVIMQMEKRKLQVLENIRHPSWCNKEAPLCKYFAFKGSNWFVWKIKENCNCCHWR